MVLEYESVHLPQKSTSFVGIHIPAPWFASGEHNPSKTHLDISAARGISTLCCLCCCLKEITHSYNVRPPELQVGL